MNTAAEATITPRAKDYSQWYLDVILAAQLMDYAPTKGCMVIRPTGMGIWERMRDDLDRRFKATGHVNAYFPLLIPKSFLAKEAEHVEGFAKECAIVTHTRLKSVVQDGKATVVPDPESRLEEEYVIRPTSETVIWHMYGKWIDSYRDLPILINQWANVVRWEMRTRPFLRTTEFLWQEGHTAHASAAEAVAEARKMLDVYRDFCEEVLAVPVVQGRKTPSERFAGALDTYTIEAYMQNGWALQAGTSHDLGQNFAKAFDVTFQNAAGVREHVYATSWGVSTRLIGALVMTHSDDTGLVLPPKVAPLPVVIVPIYRKGEEQPSVMAHVDKVAQIVKSLGLTVKVDDRDGMKPGAKYFEWERKGVCVRIEVGPKDVEKGGCLTVRRDNRAKEPVTLVALATRLPQILDAMQADLLTKARALRDANTREVATLDELAARLETEPGWFLGGWDGDAASEAAVKARCNATIRCIPFVGGEPNGRRCIVSGKPAVHTVVYARAY
jgi:prolyl-tRNA synthetase